MISTHILDLNLGQPATEVFVELQIKAGNEWRLVQELKTNSDGRIAFQNEAKAGSYKLSFKIDDYFKKQNTEAFFVVAPVVFNISDVSRKYHIPLLLSSFGYSTYRGS